jgi:hypothetical protein
MIARAARSLGLDGEVECCQIQHLDEGIDGAHRIVLVDVVVDAVRQEGGLAAIQPLNEALHGSPRSQRGNHTTLRSSTCVFTQAPKKPEVAAQP